MRLSTAIRLGRSRKGIGRANTGYFVIHPISDALYLDTLACAHLGLHRDLSVFRGDKTVAADRITAELLAEWPVLGERVKSIGGSLAEACRRHGLPFKSREWSLFKVITQLDEDDLHDSKVVELLERINL